MIDKASFFKEIRDSFALSFCLYFNLLLFNCQWSVRASLAQAAFCATCILYHIPFYLSRGFSKVSSTFFKALSIRSPCLSAEVPDYYITSLFICQEVFQKFFQLFSWFLSGFFPFGKRPGYYITSLFVCQEVFQKFFNFFRDLFSGLLAPCDGLFRVSRGRLSFSARIL